MTVDSAYVHALAGRLRIKIPKVKGAAAKAQELEEHLQELSGIESVSANPVTGNVLVLYNPQRIDQWNIIFSLTDGGYLSQNGVTAGGPVSPPSSPRGVVETVTSVMAATLMEVALSRLVGGLI
ncbi:MAG: HMA2 domain-containing protein [Desulfobaccales bacterium]